MMRGYGYGYGPMMGGGWLGWILMLVFWAVVIGGVILLVLWLVRSSKHPGTSAGQAQPTQAAHDEAVAIARRRLASGEITPEQFEAIRKTLDGS